MRKHNFKHDIILTAVFATIFGTIAACGGGKGALMNPIIQGGKSLVHLVTLPSSGHRIMPNTSGAVEANLMFAAPAPSQLAQSYDVQCAVQSGFTVPAGSLMPIPSPNSPAGSNDCNSFGPALPASPVFGQPSAKLTFFDGTLTSLVVTGKTAGGVPFQCRDITTQFSIPDNSFTQAFLDPNAHQVKIMNQLANGAVNDAGFACTGIGTDTDPVASIEVQFAKI